MEKAKSSNELNSVLSQTLNDIREGSINLESAKAIAMIADKINKNNLNAIQYKKMTSHKKGLEFFEE